MPGRSVTSTGPCATITPLSGNAAGSDSSSPRTSASLKPASERARRHTAGLARRGAGGSHPQNATSRPIARRSGPSSPGRSGSPAQPDAPMAPEAGDSEPASPASTAWRAARSRQSANRRHGAESLARQGPSRCPAHGIPSTLRHLRSVPPLPRRIPPRCPCRRIRTARARVPEGSRRLPIPCRAPTSITFRLRPSGRPATSACTVSRRIRFAARATGAFR